MAKSIDAFRTISEVADELDVPKHVLRFWEVKFAHIRPMKRGGGRRYYRPEDLELLRGIRHLLQAEGYTIKGVQKILREQGIEQVKALGRLHAQAAEKAKPKARSADRRTAPGVADAPLARTETPSPPAAGDAEAETAPGRRAVIERAIGELTACRKLLLGEIALLPEVHVRSGRAGRG